jgi:hypothetical protein
VNDAEASQSVANNTTKATFTIDTGGGTIYGAGLLSASAKSSASGKLVCSSAFAASRVLLVADTLAIKYTITAADA